MISRGRRGAARLLLAGLLAVPAAACAPRPAPAPVAPADVEAELWALNEDLRAAVLGGDRAFFEALLAEEYLGVAQGTRLLDRAAFLATFQPPPPELQPSFEVSDFTVRHDETTAVVSYLGTFRALVDGRPTAAGERLLQVFVRRDGRWRLLAEQSTPVPVPEDRTPEPGPR